MKWSQDMHIIVKVLKMYTYTPDPVYTAVCLERISTVPSSMLQKRSLRKLYYDCTKDFSDEKQAT